MTAVLATTRSAIMRNTSFFRRWWPKPQTDRAYPWGWQGWVGMVFWL